MRNKLIIHFLFVSLLFNSYLIAQNNSSINLQDQYQIKIEKLNEKISIDGKLEEQVWNTDNFVTDFWMTFPIDNERVIPERQTKVWVAYDDDFLYVAAFCKGNGPYVVQSLKRDSRSFWAGDSFSFVIDPNNQKTNAFTFGINPSNVQTEALITGQTGRRGSGSSGINSAWDNKWYSAAAEYADGWVAEMAIPFKILRFNENDQWGINFYRGISEDNSFCTWSPVPVQFRSVDLGYTGLLEFDKSPDKVKKNIAIIPYVLGSTFKNIKDDEPRKNNFQIGGDAKIALSSSLNLDLTINPDFSQVDVDEQVTNLTTVNIRFPERRLFFLENSDLFSDFGIPPMRPFFSRRIGLDDNGAPIPILYGARLSGNLNENLRLGIMNLQTKNTEDAIGQNYTSITLHQKVLSRSVVKGYIHNRQAYDGEFLDNDYNRTAGLEFNFRSPDGNWESFLGYGRSFSNGNTSDNWFGNMALRYNSRSWSFYTNYAGVDTNYNTDIGFMPRIFHYDAAQDTTHTIGFHHEFTNVSYSHYASNESSINSHRFGMIHIGDWSMGDLDLIGSTYRFSYNLTWKNSSNFSVEFTHDNKGLLFPFRFTDGPALPAGNYSFNFGAVEYASNSSKPFFFQAGIEFGEFYNGTRTQYSLNLNYINQPWGIFGLNLVQNTLNFPDPYVDDNLWLIGPKIEFNFSTTLFWTTFLQYNTQRDNFNINSRFQWRFHPLSDIFLVYSDNYAVDQWGPKNRALVLKINYWL